MYEQSLGQIVIWLLKNLQLTEENTGSGQCVCNVTHWPDQGLSNYQRQPDPGPGPGP